MAVSYELGYIAAARQLDRYRIVNADPGGVFRQAVAQPARFDANDGVEAGIEGLAAAEDLDADGVLPDAMFLARELRFDNEPQKGAQTRRVCEARTR